MTAAGVGLGANAAHAASVSMSISSGDFGQIKSGKTVTMPITVANDGTAPIKIDPAGLAAIAAPFALVSTNIVATDTVMPGEFRLIQVSYTAGPVGSMDTKTITISADEVTPGTPVTGTITLKGESLATDAASFEFTDPAAGAVVDFGTVDVGSTSAGSVTIENDGVLPLSFSSLDFLAVDGDGNPLPITVDGAPFVIEVLPGGSQTFALSYAPSNAGSWSGALTLKGFVGSREVPVATATRTIPIVGAAVVPPTPSPTPTTGTGDRGAGSNGTTAGGTPGRQLASTGADGVGGLVVGTVAVMFLLAGVVAVAKRRQQKRT
ncbi:DUF1573 domain-containing protein [Cnuibacter physcomitrellae]|nr:DUF1573 domain-containing protein [Cnuibacter physcomitrellae]